MMTSSASSTSRPALAFILLVLAGLSSTAAAASIFDVFGSSVSSLVTTQEEVPYTLIRKAHGYEERKYPTQKWVCKEHAGSLTAEAQQEAFLSLFDYLAGHNNHSLSLDMAIPASVEAPGSPDGKVFEACFYPGRKQQKDMPVPTIGELYIKARPEMTIFTRRFGGYADTEEEWRTETNSLKGVLEKAGEIIADKNYFWNLGEAGGVYGQNCLECINRYIMNNLIECLRFSYQVLVKKK